MYRSRLPRISAELILALDVSARAGAELVQARAKQRVPVSDDPPHLRDDIHLEHVGPGQYEVVAGRTATFYGHIVEHGSVNAPPHPFLVPALEESRAEIVAIAAEAIRKL